MRKGSRYEKIIKERIIKFFGLKDCGIPLLDIPQNEEPKIEKNHHQRIYDDGDNMISHQKVPFHQNLNGLCTRKIHKSSSNNYQLTTTETSNHQGYNQYITNCLRKVEPHHFENLSKISDNERIIEKLQTQLSDSQAGLDQEIEGSGRQEISQRLPRWTENQVELPLSIRKRPILLVPSSTRSKSPLNFSTALNFFSKGILEKGNGFEKNLERETSVMTFKHKIHDQNVYFDIMSSIEDLKKTDMTFVSLNSEIGSFVYSLMIVLTVRKGSLRSWKPKIERFSIQKVAFGYGKVRGYHLRTNEFQTPKHLSRLNIKVFEVLEL